MRCDDFLDRYDLLDVDEEPGFFLSLHLARCPECRSRVEALSRTLAAYREDLATEDAAIVASDDGLEERVMATVRLVPRPRRELHARDWLVTGILLVAGLAFAPFTNNFSIIKDFFGVSFSLPVALVMGLAPTIFGAVFIATHVDELEPYLRRHLHRT